VKSVAEILAGCDPEDITRWETLIETLLNEWRPVLAELAWIPPKSDDQICKEYSLPGPWVVRSLRLLLASDPGRSRTGFRERRKSEKKRVAQIRRREREKGGGPELTEEACLLLCEHYGNRCVCCGRLRKLTLDHIKPLFLGGSNAITNRQPLCGPCNRRKGLLETDYRPDQGEYAIREVGISETVRTFWLYMDLLGSEDDGSMGRD